MDAIDKLHKGLIDGSRGCGPACSSMLLGALIREANLLMLTQHVQRSIAQIKLDLTRLNMPTWYSENKQRHNCSIRSQLEPAVDRVWSNLKGLKLDDYCSK